LQIGDDRPEVIFAGRDGTFYFYSVHGGQELEFGKYRVSAML